MTLLIEPQVNPIKHFPWSRCLTRSSGRSVRCISRSCWPIRWQGWANTIATATGFLLPGVFGFLAWELKENWRLYAANRPTSLQPVRIGRHGETMLRLLRLGFHSGTLPRLFGKLRAAGETSLRTGNWKAVHRHLGSLQHVEESARDFVDRELVYLLAQCREWQGVRLEIAAVRLGWDSIGVELCRRDVAVVRCG